MTEKQKLGEPKGGDVPPARRKRVMKTDRQFCKSLAVGCLATWSVLALLGSAAYAQDAIAVVNRSGQVWARTVTASSVGSGVQLTGPNLFAAGLDDEFVLSGLYVVTKSGAVWSHPVVYQLNTLGALGPATKVPGSLFGGSDAKYVISGNNPNGILVINTAGQVWSHPVNTCSVNCPNPISIGNGSQLSGPSLFGGANDKYAVLDYQHQAANSNGRILIINTGGEVWAHDLLCGPVPPESLTCTAISIGAGYRLAGPGLFGAPNDRYLVLANSSLLVIDKAGEVWAHNVSTSAVGPGFRLNGPVLFGGSDDKYVITYDTPQAPPQ
jgi:hypothetical protein